MSEPADTIRLDFALAAFGGEMGILRNILNAYPDAVRWDDVGGGTALRKAVAHGSPHLEAVELLVERGSDINAKDADGLTPLMFAAMHNAKDVLKFLLDKGADAELTDTRGRTAAQIACECDHPETGSALAAHMKGKRDEAERQRRLAIAADAAQAHTGLVRPIKVRRFFIAGQ